MKDNEGLRVREHCEEECELEKQCFICDRVFCSRRSLLNHRRRYHDKVIIFEVCSCEKRVHGFTFSWRIPNFDELFYSGNSKKTRIRKRKGVRCKGGRNIT